MGGAKVIKGKVITGDPKTNLLSGINDCNSNKYTSHDVNDQTGIVIELEKVSKFNHIRLLPHSNDKYHYSIYVSKDETEWTKVAEKDTNGTENDWQESKFEEMTAKYIRIS